MWRAGHYLFSIPPGVFPIHLGPTLFGARAFTHLHRCQALWIPVCTVKQCVALFGTNQTNLRRFTQPSPYRGMVIKYGRKSRGSRENFPRAIIWPMVSSPGFEPPTLRSGGYDKYTSKAIIAGFRRIGVPENFILIYEECMRGRTATVATGYGPSSPLDRASKEASSGPSRIWHTFTPSPARLVPRKRPPV